MGNNDLLKMIKTQVIRDYNGNNLAMSLDSPELKNDKNLKGSSSLKKKTG